MFGVDEKEREKEKKNMGSVNATKSNRKLTFPIGVTVITISYNFKLNVSALRLKNVSEYKFKINGVIMSEPVMVNPGDTLQVTVSKQSAGVAMLTLQQILVG